MKGQIRDLLAILEPAHRRRIVLVAILMLFAVATQLASLAALYAFMENVGSGSGRVPGWLAEAAARAGFERPGIALFGVVTGILIVVANAMLVAVDLAKLRLEWEAHASISTRLLQSYLYADYPFHLRSNSSRLSRNLLAGVHEVTSGLLHPVLDLVNKSVLVVALVVFLLLIDPWITFGTAAVLGGGFAIVYLVTRGRIRRLGGQWESANRDRFRILQEAFGGIKEIKVLSREREFVARYERPSQTLARSHAQHQVLIQLPKYAVEAAAFCGVVGLLAAFALQGRSPGIILPIVTVFAVAGYRLMPALRDVVTSLSAFQFRSDLLGELRGHLQAVSAPSNVPPLVPARDIRLHDVWFRFGPDQPDILRGVNLTIQRGRMVALVGTTGSGKSTILDLLLGLLVPTKGDLLVDGIPLEGDDRLAWRRGIGYVPQEIHIADDTVTANIAFGVPSEEVDHAAVQRASHMAQIATFVEQELPEGYGTRLGERGVRLSGGQRQRIGIARALYHDPAVLVLDEATSDLDAITEAAITHAVGALSGRKTIVIVAHRLLTVRACHAVHLVADGAIVASGTYEELIHQNPQFRRMAAGDDGPTVQG